MMIGTVERKTAGKGDRQRCRQVTVFNRAFREAVTKKVRLE